MYECAYVCMYECMYVCIYIYIYMYECMCACVHVCIHAFMYVYMHVCVYVCVYVCRRHPGMQRSMTCVNCALNVHETSKNMGWLRSVGSIKLYVSSAKEPYKRDNILQKRPMI